MSNNNVMTQVDLPPAIVLDFILELSRQVRNKGISDEKAILIAKEVITAFVTKFKGKYLYIAKRKESPERAVLESLLTGEFCKNGLTVSIAERVSGIVAQKFMGEFSKQQLYFPKTDFKTKQANELRAARDSAIVEAYRLDPTTTTLFRLCDEHDLCLRRVYEIVGKARHKKPDA